MRKPGMLYLPASRLNALAIAALNASASMENCSSWLLFSSFSFLTRFIVFPPMLNLQSTIIAYVYEYFYTNSNFIWKKPQCVGTDEFVLDAVQLPLHRPRNWTGRANGRKSSVSRRIPAGSATTSPGVRLGIDRRIMQEHCLFPYLPPLPTKPAAVRIRGSLPFHREAGPRRTASSACRTVQALLQKHNCYAEKTGCQTHSQPR